MLIINKDYDLSRLVSEEGFHISHRNYNGILIYSFKIRWQVIDIDTRDKEVIVEYDGCNKIANEILEKLYDLIKKDIIRKEMIR